MERQTEILGVTAHPVAETLPEAYEAARAYWPVRVTETVYYEALGSVPPIYGSGGHWWVGEIARRLDDGRAVSLEFWTEPRPSCVAYLCKFSIVRPSNLDHAKHWHLPPATKGTP